ncbi:MAG: hypothetical protein V2I67_15465 [Thermoanaerobaculales bacterium]|jgi:hypothetical protein|nr:hypothetical protein [Thermoanaerobaculales bacterium]
MTNPRLRDLATGVGFVVLIAAVATGVNADEPDALPVSDWPIEMAVTHVDVGLHMDVATDQITGETIISYYDEVGKDLYLALSFGPGPGNCGPNDSWHCHLLDSDGDVGQYNSVAVGGGGGWAEVWVSYYDATNAALKVVRAEYYRFTGDQFSSETRTIDSGNPATSSFKGRYTAIALSPASVPHIAYQYGNPFPNVDEAQLYAHYVGVGGNCGEGADVGKWQCDLITNDEGVGEYAAIDYELDPRATVAYFDRDRGFPMVATYAGSGGNCGPSNTWLCRSVEHATHVTGKYLSLYTEASGVPHIAYYNETDESLEYATYVVSGGNCGFSSVSLQWEWQCDWIDDMGSSPASMGLAMGEDGAGYPVIAYQDATSMVGPATLKLARPYAATDWSGVPNCGPQDLLYTWLCERVDEGGSDLDEASVVAMSMNPAGEALVAYRELDSYPYPTEGRIKVAMEPRVIFTDGFEFGDTGCWAVTIP